MNSSKYLKAYHYTDISKALPLSYKSQLEFTNKIFKNFKIYLDRWGTQKCGVSTCTMYQRCKLQVIVIKSVAIDQGAENIGSCIV